MSLQDVTPIRGLPSVGAVGQVLRVRSGDTTPSWRDDAVVNVLDYGAAGDGTTDDSTAIQDAIDAAAENDTGATVYFPPGIYIAEGLTNTYKVSLRGAYTQPYNYQSSAGFQFGSVLKLKANATGPLLTSDQVNGPIKAASFIGPGNQLFQHSTIENLGFDGNRANQTTLDADIIRLHQVWSVVIKNCYFVHAKGFGIRALDCNALTIRHNHFTGAPLYLESLADSIIETNQIGGAHDAVSPVLWLAGTGDRCWANVLTQNMIFNNAAATTYTVTADAGTDVLTTGTAHGFVDNTPVIITTTGTLPAGITAGRTYYVDVQSTTTFKLAETRADLDAGTYVDITDTGSGTHTVQCGEDCNVYLSDSYTKWNLFSANRIDQAHGHNVICDRAVENVFEDNLNFGAGLGNGVGQAGYRFQNSAHRNVVSGGITDGTVYQSGAAWTNQDYGVYADSTSLDTKIRPATHIANHPSGNIVIPDLGEVEFLHLPTADFESMAGSPAIGLIAATRRNAWLFDASSNETVGTEFWVPRDWTQITVKLWWVNAGAGAGDVRWALNMDGFAAGESLNAADANNISATATAGAQDVLVETTMTAVTVTGGELIFLRVVRDATNVADTLANDAGLVAVRIERSR